MNLLSVLKNIIIVESKKEKDRGTVLFSKIIDNKLIQLKSTYHQRKERFGKESYDSLVDMYNDHLATRRSKYVQPPRIAVPDSMIKKLFENSLEKIYNSFNMVEQRGVTEQPLFYLALVLLIVGVQLFTAGFIGEMISRNATERNIYGIKDKTGF
jgi:hypothetical protein